MTVDEAIKRLRRVAKRLDSNQGIVGRRNARTAVSRELRNVRAAVDANFPSIRKAPKPRKKPLFRAVMTQKAYRRALEKLEEDGWQHVDDELGAALAAAGSRIKRIRKIRVKQRQGHGTIEWDQPSIIVAPDWAIRIGADRQRITMARKSPQARAAILTEVDLREGAGDVAL